MGHKITTQEEHPKHYEERYVEWTTWRQSSQKAQLPQRISASAAHMEGG